ncbi:hypothetical protein LTR85_004319 [Meristemomyces frigidus]|nr:hypothetical protein LTR85_004319 [Meristemomyces frigidus]
MSDTEETDYSADIDNARLAGLVATHPQRPNAGANLHANIQASLDNPDDMMFEEDEEDNAVDYEPSEDADTNQDMLLSSDSSGMPDFDNVWEHNAPNAGQPGQHDEVHQSAPTPAPTQLSGTTFSDVAFVPVSPPHPALLALARAVSALTRAGLQQEADSFRNWTLIAFDIAQYNRALTKMKPLPEQTSERADAEFAVAAVVRAESALRDGPVDGVAPGELGAEIEKYLGRKNRDRQLVTATT